MYESVSTVVGHSLGYAVLAEYVRSGSAVSLDAAYSRERAEQINRGLDESRSLFGAKHAFLQLVVELSVECSAAGWDGYNALPLDSDALLRTIEMILSLPDGFPLPEISPEPDGSISLDWIASKRRMLSVSVGKSDRLPYAWISGTDSGHGVVRSNGYSLPLKIMNEIQDVLGHAAASLRFAH